MKVIFVRKSYVPFGKPYLLVRLLPNLGTVLLTRTLEQGPGQGPGLRWQGPGQGQGLGCQGPGQGQGLESEGQAPKQ